MDFAAIATPSVICASFSTLAVSWAFRWVIDWRQAREAGFTVREIRRGHQQYVIAKSRWHARNLRRESLARLDVESSARVSVSAANDSGAHSSSTPVPAIGGQESLPVVSSPETAEKPRISKAAAESSAPRPRCLSRVIVANADQLRDFLVVELARAGHQAVKREFCDWYAAYLRWADIHSIESMPQSIFLKLLGKAPGVEKVISRLKDPRTGRVVKNDKGTPVRVYSYILDDPTRAASSSKPRRETAQQKLARETAEIDQRRERADAIPQETWAEFIANMDDQARQEAGLRKIAA